MHIGLALLGLLVILGVLLMILMIRKPWLGVGVLAAVLAGFALLALFAVRAVPCPTLVLPGVVAAEPEGVVAVVPEHVIPEEIIPPLVPVPPRPPSPVTTQPPADGQAAPGHTPASDPGSFTVLHAVPPDWDEDELKLNFHLKLASVQSLPLGQFKVDLQRASEQHAVESLAKYLRELATSARTPGLADLQDILRTLPEQKCRLVARRVIARAQTDRHMGVTSLESGVEDGRGAGVYDVTFAFPRQQLRDALDRALAAGRVKPASPNWLFSAWTTLALVVAAWLVLRTSTRRTQRPRV